MAEQTETTASTEQTESPAALAAHIAEALEAYRAGDPDCIFVELRGAYRDLNAKGNGEQTYRRFVYPGRVTADWPDCGRLPRLGGYLASERRCTEYAQIPIGSLVLDYESSVSKYKSAKAKLTIGIVTRKGTKGGEIEWLEFRALKARPVFEVTLPDGSKTEISNPQRD